MTITNGTQLAIITDGLVSNNWSFGGTTGASTQYQYSFKSEVAASSGVKRISPKLYFSYVKSKLNKTQVKKLKSRLLKLQTFVKNADAVGQKALYEEFSRMLLVAVRESEAVAAGYDVFLNKKDIEKYMYRVTENSQSTLNPVNFKKLEDFPRPVPDKVAKVIKTVKEKKLFDELHILYLDYTQEKIKSTKEKIREKDPILLGKFNYDSERFYFITDWIDEHCDLTLSKFIDTLKADNEEYDVSKVEDLTPEYIEQIKKEMEDRNGRLSSVNPSNFRDKMIEEDKAEIERLRSENAKLRDDEHFRLEDKEIAIEKALRDRHNWREDASKEKGHENLIDPMPKKPWYKRLF